LLAQYVSTEAQFKKSFKTMIARILVRYNKYFDGKKRELHTITFSEVAKYIAWRKSCKVPNTERFISDNTIRKEIFYLKKIIELADDWGYKIPHINFKKLTAGLSSGRSIERYLNKEEQILFLRNIKDCLRLPCLFAITTGLRWGNIKSFKCSQIEWSNNRILFNVKTPRVGGKVHYIALSNSVRKILELSGVKEGEVKNRYVFTQTLRGEVMPLGDHNKAFKSACDKSDIRLERGQKFHLLRHTAGTNIHNEKNNLLLVKKVLGHSDIKMSEKYSHMSDCSVSEVIDESVSHLIEKYEVE